MQQFTFKSLVFCFVFKFKDPAFAFCDMTNI